MWIRLLQTKMKRKYRWPFMKAKVKQHRSGFIESLMKKRYEAASEAGAEAKRRGGN